ncbi:MAG: bifunctional hydroxymethylpyrimidine kinase/phosphomethylpyrimidine kinase [Lentisphaeria bacterium]|nr:bifunctional hydroxymethylpyrimidine kinase/phosphomethylpyrimidine kinase [Lentisphaeria bacterium]
MAEKKKSAAVEYYPSALTIAGSDSGGGAGIEADLRTFNALGVYGCAAVTAVTAQNPESVDRVDLLPGASVTAQIDSVMAKIAVRCAKTGMLGSAENVSAVAEAVKKYNLKLICDPVMISTSGRKLIDDDAIEVLASELLPKALWITPNIPECEFLLGKKFDTPSDMIQGAKALADKFRTNVLLKGGHDEKSKRATDFVCYKGDLFTVSSPKIKLPSFASHGTGCTLSAAMAAMTALGFSWSDVIQDAKAFVFGSLRENVEIGKGIFAMYPPVEDSLELIEMERISSAKSSKGSPR